MELILRSSGLSDGRDAYVVIDHSPFRVGRRSYNDHQILHSEVSGQHAEFNFDTRGWNVKDLGSTNGTYVNGIRLPQKGRVQVNDVVHFGRVSFQVVSSIDRPMTNHATRLAPDSSEKARSVVDLIHVINGELAYPCFQPVVELLTEKVIGWEALGRAATEHPVSPTQLFEYAEQTDLAPTLSRVFRDSSRECLNCQHCWKDTSPGYLFLNLHAGEIQTRSFLEFVKKLGKDPLSRRFRLVLEIPENLVCNSEQMVVWIDSIHEQGMLVAYDDFGTGQSRISDLINAPPDYLKLDRALITGVSEDTAKDELIHGIVGACTKLGVDIIGEGIERERERYVCLKAKVEFAQGHLFSPPLPAWELFDTDVATLPGTCPFVRLGLLPQLAAAT